MLQIYINLELLITLNVFTMCGQAYFQFSNFKNVEKTKSGIKNA